MPATQFDYESELAIIMGKTARNVAEAHAFTYVYGYKLGRGGAAQDRSSC